MSDSWQNLAIQQESVKRKQELRLTHFSTQMAIRTIEDKVSDILFTYAKIQSGKYSMLEQITLLHLGSESSLKYRCI